MSKDTTSVIQKENKQAFKKFILLMIGSTLLGLVAGILAAKAQGNLADTMADAAEGLLRLITPYAIMTITVVAAILVIILFKKAKNGYQAWDGEDDEAMDRIESFLRYGMYVSNFAMLANFFFSAVGTVFLDFNSMGREGFPVVPLIFWFLSLIVNLVFVLVSQKQIVDLLKEMNPEKKGSIYDPRFMKKWKDSCDEAELVMTYQCGYKAYTSVNTACMVLWIVCLVGSTVWDFGVVPVTMVSIIWFVSVTSQMMEERRLSKCNK